MKCSACNGRGHVMRPPAPHDYEGSRYPATVKWTCSTCNGTGEQK